MEYMNSHKKKPNTTNDNINNSNNNNHNNTKYRGSIVIPYVHELCKSIKVICGKYGIYKYFRGKRTIMNILLSSKNKDPRQCKSGII